MGRRLLASLGTWLVGGGLAIAQYPPPAEIPDVLLSDRPAAESKPTPPPVVPPGRDISPYLPSARILGPLGAVVPKVENVEAAPAEQAPPVREPAALASVPGPDSASEPATVVPGLQAVGDPVPVGRRLWGSLDYLVFRVRPGPSPALIQILPAQYALVADLPPNAALTAFGSDGIDPNPFYGVRGQGGIWLDSEQTIGLEADYFQIFRESVNFSAQSNGLPLLGRGFFNVAAGRSAFLSYTQADGRQRGYIQGEAPIELYGGEVNLRWQAPSVFADRFDWIVGGRYMELREALDIWSGSTFPAPPVTTITSLESFRTKNQFYGTQTGFESHVRYNDWQLDVTGKLASGWVHQVADIAGGSARTVAGAATQFYPNQSILYVQSTNAGRRTKYRFALLPELLVRLGYQLTPHIRTTVGYDLIALTSVTRPGGIIDEGVNPSNTRFIVGNQPSNIQRPGFGFNGTDFWAQGLTAGISVIY